MAIWRLPSIVPYLPRAFQPSILGQYVSLGIIKVCSWGTQDTAEGGGSAGTVSVSTSVTRVGPTSLRCNPATTGTGSSLLNGFGSSGTPQSFSVENLYASFYFLYTTKPSSSDEDIFTVSATRGQKLYATLNSSGQISAYDSNNTIIATGTTALSDGVWYRLELKCGTGASGEWEIKINGATEISGNSDLTAAPSTSVSLGKKSNRNGNTVDFFYTDVVLSNTGYPPDGAVIPMVPDANGNYQNWTIGAGSGSHYQQVDELPSDGDTTYLVPSGGTTNAETEAIQSLSSAGVAAMDVIRCVQPMVVTKRDGVTNGLVNLRFRSGSTDSDTPSSFTTTSNYTVIGRVYETDPTTGVAWTQSGVNGVEVGLLNNDGTNLSRMTVACAMVYYTQTPGVYTATASMTIGASSLSSSATFAPPVYTATCSATVPHETFSSSAMFTAPAYVGSCAATIASKTLSSSATFAAPVYAATCSISNPAETLSASGSFIAPIYTASASISNPAETLSASGSFIATTYTASASLADAASTLSSSATFSAPVYAATCSISNPAETLSASGSFIAPIYTASASISNPAETLSASGSFIATTYTASASLIVPAETMSASGTFVVPTFSAAASVSIPAESLSSSGTFTPPVYTASASLSIRESRLSGSATFVNPVYLASASLADKAATASSLGTFSPPVYTGTSVLFSPETVASATSTFVAPVYTASSVITLGGVVISSTAIAGVGGPLEFEGVQVFSSAIYGFDVYANMASAVEFDPTLADNAEVTAMIIAAEEAATSMNAAAEIEGKLVQNNQVVP